MVSKLYAPAQHFGLEAPGLRCWQGAIVDGVISIAEAVRFGSIMSFAGSVRYIKYLRDIRIDTTVQAGNHRCDQKVDQPSTDQGHERITPAHVYLG